MNLIGNLSVEEGGGAHYRLAGVLLTEQNIQFGAVAIGRAGFGKMEQPAFLRGGGCIRVRLAKDRKTEVGK